MGFLSGAVQSYEGILFTYSDSCRNQMISINPHTFVELFSPNPATTWLQFGGWKIDQETTELVLSLEKEEEKAGVINNVFTAH